MSRKLYKRSNTYAINVQRQRLKVKIANRDFPDTQEGLQRASHFLKRVDALWHAAKSRVNERLPDAERPELQAALREEALGVKREVSSWSFQS